MGPEGIAAYISAKKFNSLIATRNHISSDSALKNSKKGFWDRFHNYFSEPVQVKENSQHYGKKSP